MRITKRDSRLLLILLGLVIFLVLYLAVCNPFEERTGDVNARIGKLKAQVQDLEEKYLHLAEYEEGIRQGRANVKELIKSFPGDIKEEDVLSYLLSMEAHEAIHLDSVTFNDPEMVKTFNAVMEKDDRDVSSEAKIYRSSTVMTGTMNYPQAKSVINYLYESARQTNLESATLSYNEETALLTGTFRLAKYYIVCDGVTYTPERIPVVDIGRTDLFGTT